MILLASGGFIHQVISRYCLGFHPSKEGQQRRKCSQDTSGHSPTLLEIPLVICSGEYIVCEGTMSGTNTGPLESPEGEMPATGRSVTLPLVFILKVGPDGLVQRDHTYFDEASFLKQLGLTG